MINKRPLFNQVRLVTEDAAVLAIRLEDLVTLMQEQKECLQKNMTEIKAQFLLLKANQRKIRIARRRIYFPD